MTFKIGVVTVSDRCSKGEATDTSGPAAVALLREAMCDISTREPPEVIVALVADEVPDIQAAVTRFADKEHCALIVTTGGTGFAERDVTPEAVSPLLTKHAASLVHAMTSSGLSHTPFAWLSRGVAGVRNKTVVITLPGSERAVRECLEPLIGKGLYHAVELASGHASSPHPERPDCEAAHGDVAEHSTVPSRRPDAVTRARVSGYAMVTASDAITTILARTADPVAQRVPLKEAVSHVLAEDVCASFPQPPFRASIKDGYAVISADGSGERNVTGSLCAGSALPPGYVLKPGDVCRVNTGGPVPNGADAVVQVEDTTLLETARGEEAKILVKVAVPVGNDIRPIGCDMATGGVAVSKGTLIGAPEIGLAASIGAAAVKVYVKPKIAVLSTGDELAELPPLSPHASHTPPNDKIFDSNRNMLIAAATEYAQTVIDCGIANDDLVQTEEKLRDAFAVSDVVISTGGVSMGEVDCVKTALINLGATIHFGRVNMKPGKPTTFASLNGKLFFALPGNPVSALVCFYVFVVPALRKLRGLTSPHLPVVLARLSHTIALDRERPDYHRCSICFTSEGFEATSSGSQASHRLASLSGANGLLVLPVATAETPSMSAGTMVKVMLIGPVQSIIGHV